MTQIWRLFLLCATGFLATPAVGQSADSQPTIQILVAYHSLSGNTERMAEAVAEGARMVSHTQVVVKRVGAVTAEELFAADAIVLGSPVYWSNMAGEVKTFIDDWQFKFGVFPEFKLRNKVGAAFATGGQISSGKELTMLSILAAMLGNYMITVSGGGAFGASATTEGNSLGIDEQELAGARELGRRVADVAGAVKRGFQLPDHRESVDVR
jgi:NAD(P)H dehydrogenase (quinone)